MDRQLKQRSIGKPDGDTVEEGNMGKNILKTDAAKQILFVTCFVAAWEIIYKQQVFNAVLFPSGKDILRNLYTGVAEEGLFSMVLYSLRLLGKGLLIGVVLAFVFSGLAMVSRTFHAIYSLLTTACDMLPGVALLPLAILWFGIGETPIVFITVHGILWPMSRNIMDGFRTVPAMYIEGGRNIGLRGVRLVTGVYIPASFNSILSGLRVGWARAWRGLLSAEMIFGTTGSGAGIGWYIFTQRQVLNTAGIFAALIVIILIGVVVEFAVFRVIEKHTVRKWGMSGK